MKGEGDNKILFTAFNRLSIIKSHISNIISLFLILIFALCIFGFPQETYAAVTALDTWTNIHSSAPNNRSGTINAGDLTVSSGSNRLLLTAVCLETSSSLYLNNIVTSVSLGGTALTKIGHTLASSTEHCYMGYLKESQIPAGSNSLSVDYDTQNDAILVTGIHVKWASYSDVIQMFPINDSNAQVAYSASVWFGAQIDYNAYGLTLYVAANGGTPATMSPPTDFSQVGSDTTTDGFSSFIAATVNHGSDGNYASGTTANFGGTTTTVSAIVVAALNPSGTITIVGDGANLTNAIICPGAVATEIDAFTLQTSEGTETVTGVTVTFSTAGFYERLSKVEITSNDGSTVYGYIDNPGSDTVAISVTDMPEVTIDEPPPQYKVRITPKSHAVMPLPLGGTYSSTGKVTGITSSNQKFYNDTNSATISIDNYSPIINPTSLSGIPGDEQVVLNWTIPILSTGVVILRNTVSPITDTPVEGEAYSRGEPIGSSTVAYDGSGTYTTDTELSNGQNYYYKIFGRDDCYNYTVAGYQAGPYTPAPVVTASSSGTQVTMMNIGSTAQYIGAAFTFQQSSGTAETITTLTISETGSAVANTKLNNNVKVYYKSDVTSCSYDGTESSIDASFDGSDKIVLSSISIPVTMSPDYTCVYVVFDVDPTAVNNSTVDLEITSSADFTLSGNTMKDGLVLYPLDLTDSTTINGSIVTLVKVGSFQSGTTWGSFPVTGVGFQPKAVIFFWTRQSSTGFSTGERIGMGFAAGPSTSPVNRGVADACNDNVSTTNCGRMRSETYSIMFLSDGTPTLSGRGYVTSFNLDGFTVAWPLGYQPGINAIINYMAIGGDAITNANAGTITALTSGNPQSYNGVGFQPDFVMFLAGRDELVDAPTTHMLFNTGFMTPTGQAAISVGGQDNQTVAGHARSQQQSTNYSLIGILAGGAQDYLASYASMDTDGFTLNFSNLPAVNIPVFYLALKGGTHKVYYFTQPTSGTPPFTQDTTTVGFQPNGLFMASVNRYSPSSIAPEGEISIGAASSPTQRGTIWGETRDVINSDANMSIMTDKAIRLATTTATVNAEADFDSFLSNGFRLNWTTRNDATAREIVYWAIAGNPIIVGDGTDLITSVYIGPGADPTEIDAFTLQSSAGVDIVSGVKVNLQAGTYAGLSKVQITSEDGSFVYGEADPASDSDPDPNNVLIELDTNIELRGGDPAREFKVMIIPKSHDDMPDPPGQQYNVFGKVIGITATNTGIYNDLGGIWVYVDNQSPSNPSNFNGVPSEGKVALTWTNPFWDCNQIIILRSNAAISDIPVEGEQYDTVINNTIGTSKVVYVHTGAPSCSATSYDDTEVFNEQTYYYKIFAKDLYGNYSSDPSGTVRGTPAGPYTAGPYVNVDYSGSQITLPAWLEAGSTSQYIGAAFRFQQVGGITPDTITALTISETRTADANVVLKNVKVYYESNVSSCSTTPAGTSINTSFSGPPNDDKIVLGSSIPLTLSPNFTCVHVVFDVDLLAVKDSTVDLEITSPSDFTLSSLVNKRGTYPVNLSGTGVWTTIKDTYAPGNITDLTVTPDDAQVIFNWTNPTDIDFVGVCIMRTTGIPPVLPPADCPADCSGGTKVEGVVTYTDSTVSNGTTYSYRLCSYDETPDPNQSSGVEVINVMPSSKPILTYPPSPYNDGKDPDTGDTTTDFRFKVIYTDYQIIPNPLGDPPASGYPKINFGDNDYYVGAGYPMSPDTSVPLGTPLRDGDYKNGEQYVYGPIGFGATADLRFYFEARAASGDTAVVTLPPNAWIPGIYNPGPSVSLLPGYNMVGVPKDLGTGLPYISVLGDDSGYSYCLFWDSYGLDTILDGFLGEFLNCTSGNIVHAKGYYIYALSGNPKRLDEPDGVENVIEPYVDIALDSEGGWTMISNPYNAKIELQDESKIKVVRNDIEYTFSQAVANNWIENSIYEWEGFVSGYDGKAFNSSPPATLDPWVGYFIYIKDTTPTTLRVYKP